MRKRRTSRRAVVGPWTPDRLREAFRQVTGAAPDEYPRHEPSAWLLGRIQRPRGFCAHLRADPARVLGPVVLPLWNGLVRCPRCLGAGVLDAELSAGAEAHTCDRCRRVVGELVSVLLTPSPRLAVVGGLCPDCYRRETGASPRPAITGETA